MAGFTPVKKVGDFIPMRRIDEKPAGPSTATGGLFETAAQGMESVEPITEDAKVALKKVVADMIVSGRSQRDIDSFLASSGVSRQELLADKYTVGRMTSQIGGGIVGGAAAGGNPLGIALGSAIGGQAYDRGAELLGKKVPETIESAAEQAALDFTLDAVSPIAFSKGLYAAKKLAGYTSEAFRDLMPKPKVPLADYKDIGVNPTVGTLTGSRSAVIAEHALSDFPISSSRFQTLAKENVDALKFSNRFLAEEYGQVLDKQDLGVLLKEGSERSLDHLKGVYDKLYKFVGNDFQGELFPVNNLSTQLNALVQRQAEGRPISQAAVEFAQGILEKAQGKGLSWDAIKEWRTELHDMMTNPMLLSQRNMSQGNIKQLYAALTKDMEDIALSKGEQTHARWRAANKYFETTINRDAPLLERIVDKGYDEEVLNALMQSSRDGGSRLKIMRKNLAPEEWDAVAGSVLGRMGQARPGAQDAAGDAFSVNTFMTNWNSLSPQAKTQLFRGSRYEQTYHELEKFVRVSDSLKEVDRLANKSRTGSVLGFLSMFSALGGTLGYAANQDVGSGLKAAAATGTALVMLPKLGAKLMTSPNFVRWLSDGVQVAKTKPDSMPVHLSRLMVLRFEPQIQDAVDEIIKSQIGDK